MSGPSSEPRPSDSSEPSAASSRTLKSRNSGIYQHNGEGSSPQRQSPASRLSTRGEYGLTNARSRDQDSPLSVEAIAEQDFAARRQRNRSSGGFLLDSTFGADPRTRHSRYDTHREDATDKRGSHHGHALDREGNQGMPRTEIGALSSSPLARDARRVDQEAADRKSRIDSANMHEQENGAIHVSKTRRSAYGMQSTAHNRPMESESTAPPPTINPTQIVHMALNLSESRRRNMSAGQHLVPKSRVSSMMNTDGSSHMQGAGSHLKQYLNDQRRASRTISPRGGVSSPARHMSTSMQRKGSLFIQGRPFNPSDATLARRDKARAFFELRVEYLRLLEFLPPLKPDSSDPRNFIVTANNVPGSPQAQLTRMPSYAGKVYELGRSYNPLQFLRNRRLRARERRTLDHLPEEFADVGQVREWVDKVESASRFSQYRQRDGVSLPRYVDDHQRPSGPTQPARPHMVWVFTAEELLADAHWLEHGDNKTMVEDRRGSKLFHPREPQKQDLLTPRPSKDLPEKRRRSWVEGLPGVSADPATGDESETTSERGRKRRLLQTFRGESPRLKKHLRLGSRPQSDVYDDFSDSDSDSHQHRLQKPRKLLDEEKDTGPLELRMRELLEKETKEAQLNSRSPAIFTPDTPNKWGRDHADVTESKSKPSRDSLEIPRVANGSLRAGLKLPPNSRTDAKPALDPSKVARSSFEENTSTAPSTPLHVRDFPRISSDLSPPPSRAGSVPRKSKKSKLDYFRSDESTKGHKLEQEQETELYPANADKHHRSRHTSEEVDEGHGIGSAIWAAPGAVKHLLGHRKNDSVNSLQSPVKESRRDGRDLKEPPSAVTRFFKGVKHEGSKVGDFIFKKDRPVEESDTDTAPDLQAADSETDEDSGKSGPKRRLGLVRSNTAQTTRSTTSRNNDHYHLDLPSFRSTQEIKDADDTAYATDASDHHITRQTRERKFGRSPRFDKLAPPPMDLSRVRSNASESASDDRIRQILTRPGGMVQSLPVTALGRGQASRSSRQSNSSRPTLEGKRHWSITDDDGNLVHRKPTSNIVTQADIARVRALFLCSGVKAKEISRRVSETRPEPPAFLTRAAKTGNTRLYPVPRREEHVLAARILVRSLESETNALQNEAEEFRENTVKELTAMIATLKSTVESDLFSQVRSSGDAAVQITSEVSSSAPLAVKQMSDEIDRMLRMRRRRMIWMRRVGWTMVEWMLVGFMWFAWLTVTIFGFFGRIFALEWSVVRWLLWL